MSRLGDALEKFFQSQVIIKRQKLNLLKIILSLLIGVGSIGIRLILGYVILSTIQVGAFVWVIFWAQIPISLAFDFLEKRLERG